MIDQPLGLGLVGCGAFGLFCLDNYRKMDDVRITAVADVRQDVADDFAREFDVPAHYDYRELIERDDVDIVHVATPPFLHYEQVLAALRAGKHVLCEKPLAVNVQQADEMLTAAENDGLLLPVNFVLRYNVVTETVKRIIDSGLLGSVLRCQLTNCASDARLDPDHWFWNKQQAGGIFVEHGVHFFDLYRHWLGDGEVISSHTETREGTKQEDRVQCTIRHENGALADHYHAFDQIGPMDRTNHRIITELGDIWIDGWIPLSMTINTALDEDAIGKLEDLCPDASIAVVRTFSADERQTAGRGINRIVEKHIHLHYTPESDKQKVYSASVRQLLADQIAHLRDKAHRRTVTEQNGRAALAYAQAAANLAEIG